MKLRPLLPCALLWPALACAAGAEAQLTFVTEQHPPHNFLGDDGQTILGSSTDIVREMLRRSGLSAKIDIYPWPRAYRLAQNDAQTCVYTTARTPAREEFFQWVGPLATAHWMLYTRADANISAQSISELTGRVFGGYQDDAKSNLLRDNGLVIDTARNEEQGLRKLMAKRIDLWVATSHTGPWLARKLGAKIKPVLIFGEGQLYAACNLQLPTQDVARMNAALRAMQADGSLQRHIANYQ